MNVILCAKNVKWLAFFALVQSLFISCMSTRVYTETQDLVYEDNVLIMEQNKLTLDGKPKKSSTTSYHDLSNAGFIITGESGANKTVHYFTASKQSDSSSSVEEIVFTLVEATVNARQETYNATVLGTRKVQSQNGTLLSYPGPNTGDAFDEDDENLLRQVVVFSAPGLAEASTAKVVEAAGKSYRTEEKIEEVKVDSVPNSSYIAYSIIGKPFVMLGSASWNILKCAGYALVNFAGGYNATSGNSSSEKLLWMVPSYSTAQKKAAAAKAANAIQYYPEYHLPFTDNTITVHRIEQDTESSFITAENAHVRRDTTERLANTLNVTRSVSADAASTAGVANLLGTAVTIPVSVVTWVAGAAAGIYIKTQ